MSDAVGVERFVPQYAFQGDSFGSFGVSFEPEGISDFFYLEQLVAGLFAELQSDFIAFLVPDIVGLAVDDLEFILIDSNLFDHPELSEIVLVGLGADDARGLVLLGVVGVDPQGLVAILTDDLVDVPAGEDQCLIALHNIFFEYKISWNSNPLNLPFNVNNSSKQEGPCLPTVRFPLDFLLPP